MNQQARFLLFVALSVGILLLWSTFVQPPKKPPQPPPAPAPGAIANAPGTTPPGANAPGPTAPGTTAPATPEAKPEGAEPPVKEVTVETEKWTATFSTKGAALAKFVLKGKKQMRHTGEGEEGFNLAHAGEDEALPLSSRIGPPGSAFTPQTTFEVASQEANGLTFRRTRGAYEVTKHFRWKPDGYGLTLEVSVKRVDNGADQVPVTVLYPAWEAAPKTGGLFSFATRAEIHSAVCYLAGSRSMETRNYRTDKPPETLTQSPLFAGIDEKYFLAAVAPVQPAQNASCTLASPTPNQIEADFTATLPVPAGAAGTQTWEIFLGPKAPEILQAWGHDADVSVYNGSIAKAGKILMPFLTAFHGFAGNWGIAIVLLTILVKLVTFPLSHRQMASMEKMKTIGPQLEALKKKYEGDPQKLNMETLQLYKQNNISPVGCAVPMLVQMPIWWALYATLGNSYELYNEPFIHGWINDLTTHDPYYVLPVLMTITMLITQVLTPQTSPQQQQMKAMTYGMPVFFGFLMMSLPAGLVLYIFTNNLLSIAQSLWFRRKFKTQTPAVK